MSVTVGDFNADGRQDLATANLIQYRVGSPGQRRWQIPEPQRISGWEPGLLGHVGDFNGDGRQDMVTANILSNNVTILVNTSLTVVNAFVTFVPVRDTFETSPDPRAARSTLSPRFAFAPGLQTRY